MTVRKIKRILTAFVFCLILSASTIPVCASAVSASNEETGYVYVLDDSADFLTDSQENSLQKQLYDLTAYCNVAFVTTTEHSKSSTKDFAADYFDDIFGPHANGTIFVIDRCLNEIYLYSDGQAHKIITNSRARSITDNTYTYARDKDYYTCANKTFALTLFIPEAGELYRRYAETHYQRNYKVEQIVGFLQQAGLVCEGMYDDYTDAGVKADSERITFVTRKE